MKQTQIERRKHAPVRRTDTEKVQVGAPDDGVRRYYDQNMEMTVVKLMTGDCYVSHEPREMLVTILGSCISACMRDPAARVGGMNHFLLPGSGSGERPNGMDPGYATRFGAFAMEQLINEILKHGGSKERLEVKIFGGGNVINNSAMIGSRNAEFAISFLQKEGIKLASKDVGGQWPRRIHFFPETGKVMMRKLHRKEDMAVVEEEKQYQAKVVKPQASQGGDVELF